MSKIYELSPEKILSIKIGFIIFIIATTISLFEPLNIFQSKEINNDALSANEIKQIAKNSTILINRGNDLRGSGVIIGQLGDTLQILTALHVVGIKPGTGGGSYDIVAPSGERWEINHTNYDQVVEKVPPDKTDLVILKLKTNNNAIDNSIPRLSSHVALDMPVYIFGYMPCSFEEWEVKACLSIKDRLYLGYYNNDEYSKYYHFSVGRLEKTTMTNKEKNNIEKEGYFSKDVGGYSIKYNNNSIKGMSGSPLFDAAGRVIGIHAFTTIIKKEEALKQCPLTFQPKWYFGANWGIPIRHLAELQSNPIFKFKHRLNIEKIPIDSKHKVFVDTVPGSNIRPVIRDKSNC